MGSWDNPIGTPPVLLIVTGPPAAGKSTIARRLAEALDLPWMGKDMIKETLFDTLGWEDREWSKKLGIASIQLLYGFAEALLHARRSCLIESNFRASLATTELQNLQNRCPFLPVQLLVLAQPEILAARTRQRAIQGLRHPGHLDSSLVDEYTPLSIPTDQMVHLNLTGPRFTLDTSQPDSIDVSRLIEEIRRDIL